MPFNFLLFCLFSLAHAEGSTVPQQEKFLLEKTIVDDKNPSLSEDQAFFLWVNNPNAGRDAMGKFFLRKKNFPLFWIQSGAKDQLEWLRSKEKEYSTQQ